MFYALIAVIILVLAIILSIIKLFGFLLKKLRSKHDQNHHDTNTTPDLERQQQQQQQHNNNNIENSILYSNNLISSTLRNPGCLTQFELDMLFPAQKLKNIKFPIFKTEKKEEIPVAVIPQQTQQNQQQKQQNQLSSQTKIITNGSLKSSQEEKQDQENKDILLTEKDITEIEISPENQQEPKNPNNNKVLSSSSSSSTGNLNSNKSDDNNNNKKTNIVHSCSSSCYTSCSSFQKENVADIICAVCQSVIGKENVEDCDLDKAPRDGQVQVRLLSCNHCFHDNCISKWLLEQQAVCPLCKRPFYDDVSVELLQLELEIIRNVLL